MPGRSLTLIHWWQRLHSDDAGLCHGERDVCEVHDCFSIAELRAVEALGFVDRGDSTCGALVGEPTLDGQLPVDPSGALLSKGHPVGVTGVGQVVEVTGQIEGRHPNQESGVEVGLTHYAGGSGASTVVHLLRVPEMPRWDTDLTEAIEANDATYLACGSCEAAMLPPREVCPRRGARDLRESTRSGTAFVASFTEIHVTIPAFVGETPYTVVVRAVGEGVRLPGQLRDAGSVAIGEDVELAVEARAERAIVTFTPP